MFVATESSNFIIRSFAVDNYKKAERAMLFVQGCRTRRGPRVPGQAAGVGCFLSSSRDGIDDSRRPDSGGDHAVPPQERQ